MQIEDKDEITHLIDTDTQYPMQGYDGVPEWDIADREKYD